MQKLAAICIRRPVFATMLIMALVVLGLAILPQARRRSVPEDRFPGRHHHHHAARRVARRGGDPGHQAHRRSRQHHQRHRRAALRLRRRRLAGHHRVHAREGPRSRGAGSSRQGLRASCASLPRDVDPPVVEKLATDASPVLNVVVASPRDLRETTKIVDDRIKKNIESLNGVGQVRFVGDRSARSRSGSTARSCTPTT